MINGLGIVGWGVGGIEAEAGMLGQPVYFLTPDVVGVHLTGALREGVTATDLALTVTQMLRKAKVVGKFVEFFGPGARALPVVDRATIANMAPEYGATMGFFPIDEECVNYLRATGRSEEHCRIRELLPRAGIVRHSEEGRDRLLRRNSNWIWRRSCRAWPGRSGRRTASRLPNLKREFARVLQAGCRKRLWQAGWRPGKQRFAVTASRAAEPGAGVATEPGRIPTRDRTGDGEQPADAGADARHEVHGAQIATATC